MIIGIDLDNTLAVYGPTFHRLAVARGLIPEHTPQSKRAVRDAVRCLANGEHAWRCLQGEAYGPRMADATPAPGAAAFLRRCFQRGARVYVVSHKNEFATEDPTRTPLREAAMDWMERQGFFSDPEPGLRRDCVFFTTTRAEKLERISALGCGHFVDDLEETFAEPGFPEGVEMILINPGPPASAPRGLICLQDFDSIGRHLLDGHGQMASQAPLHELARAAGEPLVQAESVGGGKNSQVYRLTTKSTGGLLAAKRYHRDADDPRDRRATELQALKWLWQQGERQIPRPLGSSAKLGITTFQWIEGQTPAKGSITHRDVDQAVEFLARLRGLRQAEGSDDMPPASEACLCGQHWVENIRARLERLSGAPPGAETEALTRFLVRDLEPALRRAEVCSRRSLAALDIPFEVPLQRRWQTLSPSDFGFHNTLRGSDGLVFVDFEYFGWDDPAKLACDVLLHPMMDLTVQLKQRFARRLLECFGEDRKLAPRLRQLYPLCGIKWCMILLNEFVPGDMRRRGFAGRGPSDTGQTRRRQLDLARRMLERVEREHEQFPYL